MKKIVDNESSLSSSDRYLKRITAFADFYLHLVIFSGAAALAAIIIAIVSNVILGIALALFTAAVYVYFSKSETKKQLGLCCKSVRGSIVIEKAAVAYGNGLYIPSRLMWSDVAEIADRALENHENSGLVSLYIPKSVVRIGTDIFGDIKKPDFIYYEGSQEEWEKIECLTSLEKIRLVFDSEMPVLPERKTKRPSGRRDGEDRE